MKAMILAAGHGRRMRPLTNNLPKPLLPLGKLTLIEHHIHVLCAHGITDMVINLGYLGHMIRDHLGDGTRYGVRIQYTIEDPDHLLDSGGGVKNALGALGTSPFLVVSADVWTDYPLENLLSRAGKHVAELLVVDNPSYHAYGDFSLGDDRRICLLNKDNRVTYAGIGVFCPSYFSDIHEDVFSLMRVIQQASRRDACFGSRITDAIYSNVGTPELLLKLRTLLQKRSMPCEK